MDDARLVGTLRLALDLELEARETFDAAGEDLAERDSAQIALRHVTAFRKSLELWISKRALRA